MSKDIRKKEIELQNQWGHLQDISKEDKIKKEKTFELMQMENNIYKKWLFFKGYLKAKEKTKNGK